MKILIILGLIGLAVIIFLRMNRDKWKPEE
jgi:hypothetical protein